MSVVEFPTITPHPTPFSSLREARLHDALDMAELIRDRNRAAFLSAEVRNLRAAEYLERKAEQAAAAEFRRDVALIAACGLLIAIFFQLQN